MGANFMSILMFFLGAWYMGKTIAWGRREGFTSDVLALSGIVYILCLGIMVGTFYLAVATP